VSVTDVALVCTAVPGGRAYAQVALEPAALAALAKAAADLGAAAGAAPAPAVPAFVESTAASVPLLPAALARAAVLARVVHALQGRSGLRPQLVQFFADCLNADVHFALPASDAAGLSGYLLAAAYGGPQLPPGLAAELAAKGVTHPAPGPTAPLALSNAEVGALRLGSASLALAGGAALVLGGAVEASGCADAVAALCCAGAKGGVPLELWALDGETTHAQSEKGGARARLSTARRNAFSLSKLRALLEEALARSAGPRWRTASFLFLALVLVWAFGVPPLAPNLLLAAFFFAWGNSSLQACTRGNRTAASPRPRRPSKCSCGTRPRRRPPPPLPRPTR
jgi:hypothetical protein